MPAISVIIPAYNQAPYVGQAIESICGQTFADWELVIVDDGSTDDTPQVLSRFHDSRIRVVRQVNGGLPAARNTGIRHSSAQLVTFLDADDLFMPDKLTVLNGYLEAHPEAGLVSGGMKIIDSSGQVLREHTNTSPRLTLPELLLENPIPVGGVLIRRGWLERMNGFDESMRPCGEDWDLWLRLVIAGCHLAWVQKAVVAYRIHRGQMTGDSLQMRAVMLHVLSKFFSQPDLPANLRAYQSQAFASGLVRTSARAFRSGEIEMGKLDLIEAIKLDPSLSWTGYKRLADLFRGWAADAQTQDPEAFLLTVSSHIPPTLISLRWKLRQVLAAMILESLFGASRNVWRTKRKALIKAIMYDPSWLLNRGVLRMMVDAWLTLPPKGAT